MKFGPAVLLAFATACASSGSSGPPPAPLVDPATAVALAAAELSRDGSPRADEALLAAGPDAVPWLVALSRHGSERVRRRAQSLLWSLGRTDGLSADEQVQIALFDLQRSREVPAAGLLALTRLKSLGAPAVPALKSASEGGGAGAGTARVLLALLEEGLR